MTESIAENPPPYGLAHLSFSSLRKFVEYRSAYEDLFKQTWLWHEQLGDQTEDFTMPGICVICDKQSEFKCNIRGLSEESRFKFGVNYWSSTICNCNMSNLDRSVLHILRKIQPGSIYHVGHFSNFRHFLSENYPNVVSSQYQVDREPGEVVNDVRYEDLTRLTFDDASFEAVVCMEILEHIPDYRLALRELARITQPGGQALLSFPWLGGTNYEHLTRAELTEDGTIHHILPPEYHGDPASSEGILCFRSFGWKILDELREAGFSDARAEFLFGPVHGFMTLLNPVVIGIK